MRILIATDWYLPHIGGVEVFTQRLTQELVKLGHTVQIIAPGTGLKWSEESDGEVQIRRVPAIRYPSTDVMVPVLIGNRGRIRRMITEFKPDVVHINDDVLLAEFILKQCKSLGIPTVAVNHTMSDAVLYRVFDYPWLYKILTKRYWSRNAAVYNDADLVVAPTQTAIDPLVEHGLRRPAHPISNGVDLDFYSKPPADSGKQYVEALSLGDGPVFIFIGRLDVQKRVHVIMKAFDRAAKGTDARLVVVGDGPARKGLERLKSSLSVVKNITITGRLADNEAKKALLQRADCFVIASLIESQSIATLEAMASELPVIAVNHNALPEIVHEGENGRLFGVDNVEELAANMTDAIQKHEIWKGFGRASKKIAQEHDVTQMPGNYLAAYQQVIDQKKA